MNNLAINIFDEELEIYIKTCNINDLKVNDLNVDKQNSENIWLKKIDKNQTRSIIKNSIKQNANSKLSNAKMREISKKELKSLNFELKIQKFINLPNQIENSSNRVKFFINDANIDRRTDLNSDSENYQNSLRNRLNSQINTFVQNKNLQNSNNTSFDRRSLTELGNIDELNSEEFNINSQAISNLHKDNDQLNLNHKNSNMSNINDNNRNNSNFNSQELSDDELAFLTNSSQISDPKTYNQAINSPNSKEWIKAMDKEIKDLETQNTWNLVKPPSDAHIIDGK